MQAVANLDVPCAPPPIKDYTVTLTTTEVQLLMATYLTSCPTTSPLLNPVNGYGVVLQMVQQLVAAKSYRGR